ncbi:MAG: phenylacetate--CoA ligase family protein [Candidatus Sericytochromatia bacterium]|nr:phenylacetate--CoA ligase family protein [Candidatus Tanganyikabacteria bacterium]
MTTADLAQNGRVGLVLDHAARTGFWRPRLEAAGWEPGLPAAEAPAVLARVEILTKEELTEHGPPLRTDMLSGPLREAFVFRSGGTTGKPKFAVFANGEFRALVQPFIRTYRAAGLEDSDRVANLFAGGSLYASFVFVNRCLEELGVLNLPYMMSAPPELLAAQWDLFGLNTVLGFPTHLLQAVPAIGPGKVEKLFYAGEHLYADDRRVLREKYGVRHIASAGYGAVDTGLMGFQCPRCQGAEHHLLDTHAILEIVDPETLAPVPVGEPGLILCTVLDRLLMPVLRYSIGDMGRWLDGACPCGLPERRFELLRRGDDVLRIGIANVAYDEVLSAVGECGAMQIVKERRDGRDRLLLRIEPRGEARPSGEIRERLFAVKPDIAKLVSTGHIADLAIEWVAPGELPRSPLTGKLRKTEDRA